MQQNTLFRYIKRLRVLQRKDQGFLAWQNSVSAAHTIADGQRPIEGITATVNRGMNYNQIIRSYTISRDVT